MEGSPQGPLFALPTTTALGQAESSKPALWNPGVSLWARQLASETKVAEVPSSYLTSIAVIRAAGLATPPVPGRFRTETAKTLSQPGSKLTQ